MAIDPKPWKYKEGYILGGAFVLIGIVLQMTVGPVNWRFFSWPVNIITVSILFFLSVTIFALRDKVRLFNYLGTLPSSVPVMTIAVILTIIMGLTRQVDPGTPAPDPLGFRYMLTSWPFVLIFSLLVLTVFQAFLVQATRPSLKTLPALAFHLGFVLVLVGGTLGSPDITSVSMALDKEHPQWKGTDEYGDELEMPLAVQLVSFDIEYFRPEGTDSTSMKRMMPRKFLGKVHYWTKEGDAGLADIEVNKPYKIGNHKVYLEDYEMGENGTVDTCSVAVVADSWQWVVYLGAFLLLFAALALVFMPRKKKEISK